MDFPVIIVCAILTASSNNFAECSLTDDVTDVGMVKFEKPISQKIPKSKENLRMHIHSMIFNGTLDLFMREISLPISYFGKSNTSKTAVETFTCHYTSDNGNVSLCSGITGYLHFCTFDLLVESQFSTDQDLLSDAVENSLYPVDIRKAHKENRCTNHRRLKRDTERVRFSQSTPHVIKLYMAYSQKTRAFSDDQVKNRLISIMNMVNGAYFEFKVVFALVGLGMNEYVPLYGNVQNTYTQLQSKKIKKMISRNADCYHMIMRTSSWANGGEPFGGARRESMCNRKRCVGFSVDFPGHKVRETALIVAHELAHNFGLADDKVDIDCQYCIMSPNSYQHPNKWKLAWSRKSHETMKDIIKFGLKKCISNDNLKPKQLQRSLAVCGNGIVEFDEQCDCGTAAACSYNPCCDGRTCRLVKGAQCATGRCCELNTCRFKISGTTCRKKATSCDLPEYCDGRGEYCPEDVYLRDGMPCYNQGKSHCINGNCETMRSRCQQLWGLTARKANSKCFDENLMGKTIGNCKVEFDNNRMQFINVPCLQKNKMCGRLWCDHNNIKPMFSGVSGLRSISDPSCNAVIVDLGYKNRDFGLVPDGVVCGDQKICNNSVCESLKKFNASCSCNNHGVCNSKGNCHCDDYYKPPGCIEPGNGGSLDSGPAPRRSGVPTIVVVLIILSFLFFSVIAFVVIVCIKKRKKLAEIKFRYRSVPSQRPPPQTSEKIEKKIETNKSNRSAQKPSKPKVPNKPSSVKMSNLIQGPPPRPPPKPSSLKINVKQENRTTPSPDTPPLPPYPNEYAIPNGQVADDNGKHRPKISSPIFQTSTNADLRNIPHVEITPVKKKKVNGSIPSFIPNPPRPVPLSNPPPPPPSSTKPPLPPPPPVKPTSRRP